MSGPQPDPQYVIQALSEELAAANQNRIYLLSVLKQMQAEIRDEREMWQLERESLKKAQPEAQPDEAETETD